MFCILHLLTFAQFRSWMRNKLHINPTGHAAVDAASAAAATTASTNQNSSLHNQVTSSAAAATALHHPCSQNVVLYGAACALRRHLPALLSDRLVVPQCIGAGEGEGEGGGDHELARRRAAVVADAEAHFVDDEEEDMWGQVKRCWCEWNCDAVVIHRV